MKKGIFCEVGIIYTFEPCKMKQFKYFRKTIETGEEDEIVIYTDSYFGLLKLINHWNSLEQKKFKYFV